MHERAVVDALRATAVIITDRTTYTGLPAIVLELDTSQCGDADYAQPIDLDWNSTGGWRYGLVDPENAASFLWVAYLGDTLLPTHAVMSNLVEQLDRAAYAAGDVD